MALGEGALMNVIVLVTTVLKSELGVELDGVGVVPFIKVMVLVTIVLNGGLVIAEVGEVGRVAS